MEPGNFVYNGLLRSEMENEGMEAYLDNAATTQAFSEVCDVVGKVLYTDFGNPSSKHTKGMEAEQYIKKAKTVIAGTLKCQEKEIVFTSGGTEANNMALLGGALANQRAGKHIISTRIEHPSVYEPLGYLETLGFEVTYLPVNKNGQVTLESLKEALRADTILVSVMYVNNEIGSVQPIEAIGQYLKEAAPKVLFHVDAIQAYGKYRIVPKKAGIDFLSVSGHKVHGPKGTGFLYVRDKAKIKPVLYGGGQQNGMRSGTENVPGIAGISTAVEKIYENHLTKKETLYQLKQLFIQEIQQMEGVQIHGLDGISIEETAPHIVSVGFEDIKSEVLLHALAGEGVFVSSGSACSSNHPELSGTLQAIGVSPQMLDATLRFSFSVNTTKEEIMHCIAVLKKTLPMLRKFTKK